MFYFDFSQRAHISIRIEIIKTKKKSVIIISQIKIVMAVIVIFYKIFQTMRQ